MSPHLRRIAPAGLMMLIALNLGLAPTSIAAPAPLSISITSVDITPQIDPLDSQTHDFVVISGTASNVGAATVDDTLTLETGPAIGTRSELADVIQTHDAKRLRAAAIDPIAINGLANQESKPWSFRIRADELWGTHDSGVFPIGVSASNGLVKEVVAQAWFGNRADVTPTHITTAVVLSSTKHMSDEQDAKAIALAEANRIAGLTAGELDDQSFIVDNYVLDLLATVNSPEAKATATRMETLKTAASIYGNSDLPRLIAGKQRAAITRALELTPNTGNVLYLPNSEKPILPSFGARLDSVLIPVISNVAVAGDQYATVEALGKSDSQRVLIADQGLNNCLTLKDPFATQWCISSQLGMITAESPNASRHVLMVTPTSWSPDSTMRTAVARALNTSLGHKTESLSTLLRSTPATNLSTDNRTPEKFDSSLRKVEREVLRTQISIENVFGNTDISESLTSISVLMYSQNWKSAATAKHFGRVHAQQAHELLNQLRLEGSKHVTIPGTKANLPITVFNSSAYVAHVQVMVAGTGANRLSASPSDLVAVEPGSRVSVQIPITLNSAGDVQAVVYLADSNGATFGDSLSIQIASTAYQQFARSLVWVALTALVLLVGSNVWRRTRNTSTNVSA